MHCPSLCSCCPSLPFFPFSLNFAWVVFSVTFSLVLSIVDLCPVTSRVSSGLYRPISNFKSFSCTKFVRVLTISEFLLVSKHSDIGSKSLLRRGLRTYLAFIVWVLVPSSPFPTSSVLPRYGFGLASARHTRGAVSCVAVVCFLMPAFYSEC